MNIQVFDVPGCFIRFTVVIDRENGNKEFYSMSENPHHSMGLNMFCGSNEDGYKEGNHLGKKLKGIPKCIYDAVKKRISNGNSNGNGNGVLAK